MWATCWGGEVEVLTQRDLADQGCDNPECDNPDCRNPPQLFFHSGCHDEGLDAVYDKASGVLALVCRECETPVAVFLPAVGGR
jgi:hypothetical protein